MISVEEARGRILANITPVGAETVALAQGLGRVLAAPVVARLNQPPADVSAMDGYALRAVDAAPGARLRLIGEAPAGRPFGGVVGPREAVRVFTGSVIPEGADAVIIQEDVDLDTGFVSPRDGAVPGRHIRPRAQDFAQGTELLGRGERLTARGLGLAAAANTPWLSVHRRPRVAILCTGDEISLPGEPLMAGGIVNSNAALLSAFVAAQGGEPLVLPMARDDISAIAQGADAARGADLLVTSGGASVGTHDLIQTGLAERGFALDFWKIAMRPGKPLIFGRVGTLPVLGLPGNPVSAYVCALLFLAPLLAALAGQGAAAGLPVLEPAPLGAPLKANDQREDFLRARLVASELGEVVVPYDYQDSSQLRALAGAEALICRKPFAPAAGPGALVQIIRLRNT
ncbi:gephyrin-like molybdotransferase Glp [Acidocella sp.]|uniref:molybdopterin molybdotransferase MoeA n=1 Tax=Acidocella sp. TaxID=50710 RepID=UPI002633EA16|nr:gephyrin-like molybdotransferase Glp [Acidocella sp.]